jgi:hypothetical protein
MLLCYCTLSIFYGRPKLPWSAAGSSNIYVYIYIYLPVPVALISGRDGWLSWGLPVLVTIVFRPAPIVLRAVQCADTQPMVMVDFESLELVNNGLGHEHLASRFVFQQCTKGILLFHCSIRGIPVPVVGVRVRGIHGVRGNLVGFPGPVLVIGLLVRFDLPRGRKSLGHHFSLQPLRTQVGRLVLRQGCGRWWPSPSHALQASPSRSIPRVDARWQPPWVRRIDRPSSHHVPQLVETWKQEQLLGSSWIQFWQWRGHQFLVLRHWQAIPNSLRIVVVVVVVP